MTTGRKDIDQLFREKLGDYEKAPPIFLLSNIQSSLSSNRRVQKLFILKTAVVAASIIVAFLAGWQMTGSNDTNISKPLGASTPVIMNNTAPSSVKDNSGDSEDVTNSNLKSGAVDRSNNLNTTSSPNISSFAAFAANTSFIRNDNHLATPKSEELVLSNTEKEFLDKFQNHLKLVKKFTDWIASSIRKDSISIGSYESKSLALTNYKPVNTDNSVSSSANNSHRINSSKWILKAELSPVFNSQIQNNASKTGDQSGSSQGYTSQWTTAENTFAGGVVAGYKIGKRLIIKSGVAYNNIRQTTRNTDFTGVNSMSDQPGNSTIAFTPSGQVRITKTAESLNDAILKSNSQFNSTANYSDAGVLKQNIEFIEIPLQATYQLINRKVEIGLTGGFSTNILIGNNALLFDYGNLTGSGETSNLRKVVYSGAVGLEVGYAINDRITLTVEPRLKHYINSLNTSKTVDFKPFQMGIATGLIYSFN
ncbi:MAG: outer membrane beta-barrel protein [Mariniphaga sp.]